MTAEEIGQLPTDQTPTRLAIAALLLANDRSPVDRHTAAELALSRADALLEVYVREDAKTEEPSPIIRMGGVRRVGLRGIPADPPESGVNLAEPLPEPIHEHAQRCMLCGTTTTNGLPTCGHSPNHLRLDD